MSTVAMRVMRVVVMGVSGCGKSTVGQGLALQLGHRFLEGDELHPPENVQRMAEGIPLTDADRAGWLTRIAAEVAGAAARGEGLVVTCSALKRAYRDQLRAACGDLHFVYLHGPHTLLQQRLQARQGHYMPASLLDSQLSTLEPPGADEQVLPLDIRMPVANLIDAARAALERP